MFHLIHKIPMIVKALPVFLAVLQISGLHWVGLQGIAWSTMLWNYTAQIGDFTEAAELTLDGSAPCPLCLAIEEGRRIESAPTSSGEPVPVPAENRSLTIPLIADLLRDDRVACHQAFIWSVRLSDHHETAVSARPTPPDPPPPRSAILQITVSPA